MTFSSRSSTRLKIGQPYMWELGRSAERQPHVWNWVGQHLKLKQSAERQPRV